MCDALRPVAFALAVGLTSFGGRAAGAQGTAVPPGDTTYEARLAHLVAAHESAMANVRRADSARATLLSTIRTGTLVIVAGMRDTAVVAAAAAAAWRDLSRTFGHQLEVAPIQIDASARKGWTVPELALQFVSSASGAILDRDPDLRAWLGGARLDSAALAGAGAAAYVALVTTPSRAVRRCFAGEVAACGHALGLSGTGDVLLRDYDAADRRALAERERNSANAANAAAYDNCAQGDDVSCLDVLRAASTAGYIPLGSSARSVLLSVALDAGGPDVFSRMIPMDQPVGTRLERAAGIPSDSLLARWRARVLASRPVRVTTPRTMAVAAVGWALLFSVAATRSTRWR